MIEWIKTVFVNAPSWSEPFEHIVLGVASIIGGLWVLLRLIQERLWDSALDIDIRSSMIPTETHPLSFLEVKLTNKGKVQLRAKVRRTRGLAFEDEAEQIKYSCSLKLKKLRPCIVNADAWINWFDDKNFEAMQFVEIDLLNEYEDPNRDNRTDFWMEPGEVYKLGVPLALTSGIYLAKVTFIGKRSDSEFWSRIKVIDIPATGGGATATFPVSGGV
jgi:hypothetical protein